MEKKEKIVALYVFIDEDKEEDIGLMVKAMNGITQEGNLKFNSYIVSVEEE